MTFFKWLRQDWPFICVLLGIALVPIVVITARRDPKMDAARVKDIDAVIERLDRIEKRLDLAQEKR